MDAEGGGTITVEAMEFYLGNPELSLYLESMDIHSNEARNLFHLLDRDLSGHVSIDEFCEGCLRVKGPAKSYDVQVVIAHIEHMEKSLAHVSKRQADVIDLLAGVIGE